MTTENAQTPLWVPVDLGPPELPASAETAPSRQDEAAAAEVRLVVYTAPRGKGRPRFNRQTGIPHTDSATRHEEQAIRHAWVQAGKPQLAGETPLHLDVTLYVQRPLYHLKTSGGLTKKGERETLPFKTKPDGDNAAKLVADALEKYAYPRDVAITDWQIRRRWADPTEGPRLVIWIREIRL